MNFDWNNFGDVDLEQQNQGFLAPQTQPEYKSLHDYMSQVYGDKNGDVNWAALANHPDYNQHDWYLSAPDNHGKSSLGSILAMIGA